MADKRIRAKGWIRNCDLLDTGDVWA